ncbi:MAG: ATP-dependent RecD-like DNA helicase, partial [Planctomycetes bacterium]|nr:ATP-dependent RecD-like DNA helicase [Planctomycetota bacterium]
MSEAIAGTIERVTFHNPDNGFVVLRALVKGERHPVTVVGQVARAIAGEYLDATGAWHEDPEHGRQFKADSIRTAAPSSIEGIEKYLGSGLVKGIGPQYAHRIVAVFGEKTLDIIDESPTFLKEVKGIGPHRIQKIRQSWQQQKAVRDIMLFLQSHGISAGRAVRIYKTYGDQAVAKVRANPYALADDIWGIGFQTADELARKLGIDAHAPARAGAALRYALTQFADEGHCAATETQVLERAAKLTGIRREVLETAVNTALEQKEMIRDAGLA